MYVTIYLSRFSHQECSRSQLPNYAKVGRHGPAVEANAPRPAKASMVQTVAQRIQLQLKAGRIGRAPQRSARRTPASPRHPLEHASLREDRKEAARMPCLR